MLSRRDRAMVTECVWERGSDGLYWYTVRTDRTGTKGFRVRGVNYLSETDAVAERLRAEGFVPGGMITIGQLHKGPSTRSLWAVIEPGVHILVGQVVDGLEAICGPLVYAHFADVAGVGYHPSAEQVDVARQAAEAIPWLGKKARGILEKSGLFSDVRDGSEYIAGKGPLWGDADVWEVR